MPSLPSLRRYLPSEMLDELIASVEATMEAERALPHGHG